MEIVIGAVSQTNLGGRSRPEAEAAMVEARLLDSREPRKKRGIPPAGERRESFTIEDPINGRVLVLLVPESHRIPRGVESGKFKIYLRFVPR